MRKRLGAYLDKAFFDPASMFRRPQDVADDPNLAIGQKINILCQWAYDASELAVAEEEGMSGAKPNDVHAVMLVLHHVTKGIDAEYTSPTKHAAFYVR
jgi:hypothetical protein